MLQHVLDDWADRAACRHAHFGALCPERFQVHLGVVFHVESVADGGQRGHAAQHLERHLHRPGLVGQEHGLLDDVARGFLRAGKRAAQHHRVPAEHQRLEDRAVPLHTPISNERDTTVEAGLESAFDERVDLRDAEARGDARRTAAPGADADLDGVDAAVDEEPHPVTRRDVAADQLHVPEARADSLDGPRHHHGVAMCDVDHQHVHAGLDEFGCTLQVVSRGADGGADAKPALSVARRKRQVCLLHQVARRDQTEEHAFAIDQRQLLDLACDHQPLGLGERNVADAYHERLHRSHARCHRPAVCRHEPHVAVREQPLQALRTVHHHQSAHARPAHQRGGLVQSRLRSHGVGLANHAMLCALDLLDLADLRFDVTRPEAPIDDANPALLGLHDCHRRPRHRVHVCRHDRSLERQVLGKATGEIDGRRVAPLDDALVWAEEEVVERAALDCVKKLGQ